MISHFSLFPTPTCLENISFHFRPLLLILVRESVIVEPQLTHLETPICGGHNFVDLFSATSFCYTDLFHLKPWPSTSSWTESRGGSCICNESFGVPGVSSICLGKTKRDVPYVCVCVSLSSWCQALFPYRPTPLWMRGSVFPILPQMKSTLKTEGAADSSTNRNRGEENLA